MSPHYFVKYKKSDDPCRIVEHTHNTSTIQPALVGATQVLLGKTIINSVNWTFQTRYTVARGDMDTYFVMYW